MRWTVSPSHWKGEVRVRLPGPKPVDQPLRLVLCVMSADPKLLTSVAYIYRQRYRDRALGSTAHPLLRDLRPRKRRWYQRAWAWLRRHPVSEFPRAHAIKYAIKYPDAR